MAPLDLMAGLADLEPDAPTGPNLELDGEFGALERAALGTPERQSGDTIIAAEDPNWKEVVTLATTLLERTHDLRVLVHLAVARLNTEGIPGFAGVLSMIRERLDTRWDEVHPQLDPEDDNDPTLRANALLQLAHPIRVLRVLRLVRLASSERAGPVSWRTITVSLGGVENAPDSEKRTEAEIRAAFAESRASVSVLGDAVALCLHELAGTGAAFDTHCGYGNGPDFEPLAKLLQEIAHYINLYAVREDGVAAEPDFGAEPAGGETAETASPRAARGAVTAAALTAITNRADVVRLLDLVCRYYEQYEPSSPLPLLIGRARGMVDMGFLEILQELAPDGLGQAQSVVKSRET